MDDQTVQLIATAIIVVTQIYAAEPWKFPVLAKVWDIIARICGELATAFADVAMQARLNYYMVVNNVS